MLKSFYLSKVLKIEEQGHSNYCVCANMTNTKYSQYIFTQQSIINAIIDVGVGSKGKFSTSSITGQVCED